MPSVARFPSPPSAAVHPAREIARHRGRNRARLSARQPRPDWREKLADRAFSSDYRKALFSAGQEVLFLKVERINLLRTDKSLYKRSALRIQTHPPASTSGIL